MSVLRVMCVSVCMSPSVCKTERERMRGRECEGENERERMRERARRRARKIFSATSRGRPAATPRTHNGKKSLTRMIAADQLVGREVSFSKSGFQFPKGASRASERASERALKARSVV